MRIVIFGLPALTIAAGLIIACNAQQPDRRKLEGRRPSGTPCIYFLPTCARA